MKSIILFFISIYSFIAFSQETNNLFIPVENENECLFVPSIKMLDSSRYSATVKNDFSEDDPIVFNVYYHIINLDDGSNPYANEQDILASVAQINIDFNQYNIFFKYRGTRNINNTDMFYNGFIISELELENYPNYINVIVPRDAGQAGIAYPGQQWIFIGVTVLNSPNIITHEFGHLMGLLHTFTGSGLGTDTVPNTICEAIPGETESPSELKTPDNFIAIAENVTRDVNSSYYNADTNGDLVVDTPACFKKSAYNYCLNMETNEVNYISHPDIVDNSGTNESYIDIDIRNFMNYGILARTHFTNGQGVRMRETILNPDNTQYTPRMTEISALYEPYEGIYFTCGNYNEYASNPPLFQPGFDYVFLECGDGSNEMYIEPTEYEDISFTYTNKVQTSFKPIDWSIPITHWNPSAIRIDQIDNEQPRKCWNNPTKGGANGGHVIHFKDGIINSNIDIYPKDSLQINDSHLIENLNNGLYKIQKQYNDGSQEQNVILKNDD